MHDSGLNHSSSLCITLSLTMTSQSNIIASITHLGHVSPPLGIKIIPLLVAIFLSSSSYFKPHTSSYSKLLSSACCTQSSTPLIQDCEFKIRYLSFFLTPFRLSIFSRVSSLKIELRTDCSLIFLRGGKFS